MRSLIAALLCLVPLSSVEAKPSPYRADTFSGDRYVARVAQSAQDVTRAMGCPPPACQRGRASQAKHLYRTKPARHRSVPVPRSRPGIVAPLTMAEGFTREMRTAATTVIGGRPSGCPARAWCGCWLASHLGIHDRTLWLARNWARVGSNAGGPRPGAIAVWRHHVGKITAVEGNRIRVLSGNDGRRVRERWRTTAGVIAYRTRG